MTDGVQPPPDDPAASGSGEFSAGAGAETALSGDAPQDTGELTGEDLDVLMRAAASVNAAAESGMASKGGTPAKAGARVAAASGAGPFLHGAAESQARGGFGLELPEFKQGGGTPVSEERISMLSDVNLNVKIELGRTRMLIEDVLRLDEGSVVELDKLAGDPVDVYANDRLIARGEVLVLNDSFCVRISEVFAGDPHRVV